MDIGDETQSVHLLNSNNKIYKNFFLSNSFEMGLNLKIFWGFVLIRIKKILPQG